MKNFFISYNRHDKQWAEWIAWTLEEAEYTIVLQAWDFRPGDNFVLDMERAYTSSIMSGEKIKNQGVVKYVSRVKEKRRIQRRHSSFYIGIHGYA